MVEIIEVSLNNKLDNDDISLEISKKVKNKPKTKKEEKKEEIIEVKSDIEKKDEINLIDLKEEEVKSEKKEENKISIIEKVISYKL